MINVWFVLSCLMVAACGGDGDPGGVPSDRRLNQLSASEAESFCDEWVDAALTFECDGEEFSFGPASQEACIETTNFAKTEAPDCPVTVGQVLDCMDALGSFDGEELCDGTTELPQSCEPLASDECAGI